MITGNDLRADWRACPKVVELDVRTGKRWMVKNNRKFTKGNNL